MLSKGIAITSLLALPHVNAFFNSDPKILDYTLKEHRDGSVHVFEPNQGRKLFRLGAEKQPNDNVFKVHGNMYVAGTLELDSIKGEQDKNVLAMFDQHGIAHVAPLKSVKDEGVVECSICSRSLNDALGGTEKYFATESQLRELSNGTMAAQNVNIEALADSVKEINGEVSSLDTGLKENDGEVSSLDTGLKENDGEVSSLDTGLKANDGEVSSLDTGLKANDGEVSSLDTGLKANDDEVSSLDTGLKANDGEVSSLDTGLKENDGEVSSLDTGLKKVELEIDDAIKVAQFALDEVDHQLPGLLEHNSITELSGILSHMVSADFHYSTGIFAIHDAHVKELAEGSNHARTETLAMIKILCNTLGVSFNNLYLQAVGISQPATAEYINVMNRAHNVGFATVQIASGSIGSGNTCFTTDGQGVTSANSDQPCNLD